MGGCPSSANASLMAEVLVAGQGLNLTHSDRSRISGTYGTDSTVARLLGGVRFR